MRILVVEDDILIRKSLEKNLRGESFIVDSATDGSKGSFMARSNDYDVIILDNILPLKMGIDVCKEIRNAGKTTPILLLSVNLEVSEKINLLSAGADDYISKPYFHNELVARIKALVRRDPVVRSCILTTHNLTLDCETYEVMRGKKSIYLTRKEFWLLELLMRNKGKILSRVAILEHVWGIHGDFVSKTVETHVLTLRRKIERGHKKLIHNVLGRGYKIIE